MAATTIGTSGLLFGITAESGGLVQSFTETRNVERAEVRNQSGEVVGVGIYNPTDTFAFSTTKLNSPFLSFTFPFMAMQASGVKILFNCS